MKKTNNQLPFGLSNYYYNCFINSALQSLFGMQDFNTIIGQIQNPSKLVQLYLQTAQGKDIKPLLDCIYEIDQQWKSQHDSQEFLVWFIEQIIEAHKLNNPIEINYKETRKYLTQCPHQKSSTQNIKDQLLYIYDNQPILECLRQSQSLNTIVCETCKKELNVQITQKCQEVPLYLVCVVNCTNYQIIREFDQYILKAIIVYVNKDHYVSIVNRDKKWFLCDDSQIREIQDNFGIVNHTRVLIYHYQESSK